MKLSLESGFQRTVRSMFGIICIIALFSPLAVYHYLGEASISGTLWAFMTPIGYVALILGIILVLYPKLWLHRRLRFPNLLIASGILMIIIYLVQPVKFFLALWHGTTVEYDIDMYSPLVSLPFYLGVVSLLYGVFSKGLHKRRA